MNIIDIFLQFFVHLDKNLEILISSYGVLIYPIIFIIIFAETGLVLFPFLPGDSLLFASGALAALGSLNVLLLFLIILIAAVLGDTINYWIGYYLGPRVFREKARFFKREYLDSTQEFYSKYGSKTIVLARFIPIIRTFAPFIAGIGSMNYTRFLLYNVIGGLAWVALFLFGGYFLGTLEIVKNNFSLFILAIIFISVIPGIIEFLRHKLKN